MNIKITPYKHGDGGIVCMPLKSNVPDLSHKPGWEIVACSACGAECWESDLIRKVKSKGCTAACTECALRAGISGRS